MTEIAKGLSVDLSQVSAVEREGNKVILHIHGVTFEWNMTYQLAMAEIERIKRNASNYALIG